MNMLQEQDVVKSLKEIARQLTLIAALLQTIAKKS
jgi:hypothetical protein